MKLLIVDDHAMNLKVLRAQLEAEGHSVLQADDGVAALELLDREAVDGVISDILMPRMDGYRLCLEVRKSTRYGQIPFVLYTNTYNSPADRKLAELAGADAYIHKPAPTHRLLEALRSAARNPRVHVPVGTDHEIDSPILKQYSETLIRKLEEKSLELERAHDGLVQIEARLSGLVESAMDAIIAIDARHTIVLFNAAAGRMFGCDPATAIGGPLHRFLPQRFRQSHAADIEAFGNGTANQRQMGVRSVSALRADGSEFPVEASISKLQTSQGRLFTVFVRDITERQRADKALASSEAGLRRAQEVAQLAHMITEPDGVFETWSETLPHLIGVDEANVPHSIREWMEIIHPDDRATFRDVVIDAARTGHRSEIGYRIRRHEDWIDARHVMEPLIDDPDGAQIGKRWFNTLQDVSEQKAAEARILSLNRVYAVLSGINTLIVRAQDRNELFREACRIAVDVGKFSKAWIGIIENGYVPVRLVACHEVDDAFFETLQNKLRTNAIGNKGVLAQAITGMLPIVSNDIKNDPRVLERTALAASGSRSLAIFPLVTDGKVVGVLSLHAPVTDFFDSEEMKLLRELASDISFALDHFGKTERIHYLGNYDALTGLPNRTLFMERLSMRIEAIKDKDGMLAVALLDLERFRLVNETLGLAGGDELLKMAASRLRGINASVARIGVDLFVFEVQGKQSVIEIAHALEEIAARCFGESFHVQGEELRVGCRKGVALFPTDGGDAETLLRNAESALHRAKGTSEHCVFYARDMNARAAEALALESRLRRAVEREEFTLHYQPKVCFADGRIAGVEALIRWQDPERGLVAPGEFISILEESGLIDIVGQWALRQAMADHRRWRAAGFAPLRVAVNVSPRQLQQRDFAARIGEIVGADDGNALEIELTESVIMANVERNITTLKEIRGHGVSIAIDDFGTGYCSLSYIAKLPVTSLKIDRAFVTGMTQGPEGMTLVSSIIALAHALRLKVVAEGVETGEQARLLHLLACDEAQGYLYSRPVSAAAIEALLAAGGTLPLTSIP